MKLNENNIMGIDLGVTPCTGVWIETYVDVLNDTTPQSHSLHGSVD